MFQGLRWYIRGFGIDSLVNTQCEMILTSYSKFKGQLSRLLAETYSQIQAIHPIALLCIHIALCPFSEYVLLDFSCTRFRQLIHYYNLPRHHEPTDVALLLSPLNDFIAQRLTARTIFGRNEGFGSLTPVRICNCTNTHFENRRVRREHAFEGYGGNILTT